MRVVEPVQRAPRQLAPNRLLNRAQIRLLLRRYQRERLARRLGARRAAHAVDVILRDVRHVEVHHVLECFDVNAARNDVRGHEHADLPRLEVAEGLGALPLAPVAVDLGVGNPAAGQHIGQTIGAMLGPREADNVANHVRAEQREEEIGL